jgi:hypothetical protein
MVVVRPWKLPSTDEDLGALVGDAERCSVAVAPHAALMAVSTASAPVFIGSTFSYPSSLLSSFMERAELVVVERARGQRAAIGLLVQRLHDARMAVALS